MLSTSLENMKIFDLAKYILTGLVEKYKECISIYMENKTWKRCNNKVSKGNFLADLIKAATGPTEHFTAVELQNPSNDVIVVCASPNF